MAIQIYCNNRQVLSVLLNKLSYMIDRQINLGYFSLFTLKPKYEMDDNILAEIFEKVSNDIDNMENISIIVSEFLGDFFTNLDLNILYPNSDVLDLDDFDEDEDDLSEFKERNKDISEQEQLDLILDQIASKGIDSLDVNQKIFLELNSR